MRYKVIYQTNTSAGEQTFAEAETFTAAVITAQPLYRKRREPNSDIKAICIEDTEDIQES